MSDPGLVDPREPLERQNAKLHKIAQALMRRVEYGAEQSGAAYAQFERAALLEKRVRERTLELERTLDLLHESNAQLAQANADTEAARRNLADAIETVSEGFALFDPAETLVMCNSRFCRDFRDTARDLSPGLPFAGYVERVSQSRYLSLPEGQTPRQWAAGRLRRHRDRHVMFNVQLAQDRWLQVSEHRTANGGTVVLQTDVTDIVRLERQERARLKDKQTRIIRATLDHLNQGVGIFDENARLVAWNTKIGTLLSVPARRLQLGASFPVLLDQLDDEIAFTRGVDREVFRSWAMADGPRDTISFEVRKGTLALDIFGRGMPDGGFLVSCTDVTAERDAAAQLYQLNEMLEARVMERTLELEDALGAAERANASKSRFVAAASHDLLQPLAAAKLFVSTVADNLADGRDRAVLEKAESALTSAEALIDALLDISKLDSDALSFDIRPVALHEVLAPLRDEMEVLAARKGLALTMVDSTLTVQTDPAYLRRIVQNLMSNAIRYTQTGRVLVGVRRNGGSARIEVWDTGPGIAEKDQSAIFEEFRRLDSRASASEGLGLGLAIVERACARLGHPLGMWSEVGRGSCFMLGVPIASQTDLPEKRRNLPPARPKALAQAGLIALLVDNEPQIRRALCALIESWGVHVIEAEDSESALDLLDVLEISPDVLLLDYQLGAGDTGLDLYRTIRTRTGPLPCAIISADRSAQLRQACRAEAVELIQKPVDRGKLGLFLEALVAPAPIP